MKERITSGIVPFSIHRGTIVFLLGREVPFGNGESIWCGFEGGGDKGETSEAVVAARECQEESMGCVFVDTCEDLTRALLRGEYYVRSDYTVLSRGGTQEQRCTLYAKYVPYDPFVEVRFRETRRRVLQLKARYDRLTQAYMSPLSHCIPEGHAGSRRASQASAASTTADGGTACAEPPAFESVWGVNEYCAFGTTGYQIRRKTAQGDFDTVELPYEMVSKVVQKDMQLWFEQMQKLIDDIQRGIDADNLGGAVELIRDEANVVVGVHFRPERMEKTAVAWWTCQRLEESFKWRRTRRLFRGRFVNMMGAILHMIEDMSSVQAKQTLSPHAHAQRCALTERIQRATEKWPRTRYPRTRSASTASANLAEPHGAV